MYINNFIKAEIFCSGFQLFFQVVLLGREFHAAPQVFIESEPVKERNILESDSDPMSWSDYPAAANGCGAIKINPTVTMKNRDDDEKTLLLDTDTAKWTCAQVINYLQYVFFSPDMATCCG
jgi:hypothetical protein